MIWLKIFLSLIALHGPDGRETDVSIDEITSLQCKMPGVENKLFTDTVNSIVYLTDGRFVSVRETCSEIRDMVKEATK